MYQKHPNTEKDNWIKSDQSGFINYSPKDTSHYIGLDYIRLEKNILRLHFLTPEREQHFFNSFANDVDIAGAFRRVSTMRSLNVFGQHLAVTTENSKTMGLVLRTIHHKLPFNGNDMKDIINYLNLPEDAFEDTHSYNTCTII